MQATRILLAAVMTVGALSGCAVATAIDPAQRPAPWAVTLTGTPLTNVHRVTERLFRSAQPSKEAFVYLDSQAAAAQPLLPVRTVVSLRGFTQENDFVAPSSALRYEQIRFKTWHPEEEDVVKFLRIANTPALQPVLVHCEHGSDRTGTMVAIYRVVYEGWTKEEAIREMMQGGYGFHLIWGHLARYIDNLDIEALKAKVERAGPWPS